MTLNNEAKSNLDEWYKITAKLKIIKAKNSADVDKPSQPSYRFVVAIPTKFRTGIYPKEITLTGIEDNHEWSCNWYDMYESEPSKELQRLVKLVRDLKSSNKHLRDRNQALEKHFTRTSFDEMFESRQKESATPECNMCMETIDMKTSIEGVNHIYLSEGEIAHLECVVNSFNSKCSECGGVFEYDGDEESSCPMCNSTEYNSVSKDEIRKALTYDAVKHYLPKELHDKVQLQKLRDVGVNQQ